MSDYQSGTTKTSGYTVTPSNTPSYNNVYGGSSTISPYSTLYNQPTSPYSSNNYSTTTAPPYKYTTATPYPYSSGSQSYSQTYYNPASSGAGTNIYGYNYDNSVTSSPPLVQNENYQYVDTQTQQRYLQNRYSGDAYSGASNSLMYDSGLTAPVLSDDQQNQVNHQSYR